MSTMDDLAAHRKRLTERLERVDAERQKLVEELAELDTAERVLTRLSPTKSAAAQRRVGRRRSIKAVKPVQSAVRGKVGRGARKQSTRRKLPLGDATLRAVKAIGKEVSAEQIRGYLGRKLGMQVLPLHLGRALQSHRRAGRLSQQNGSWSMPRAGSAEPTAAE
jgi:hypothetical protein